MEPVVADECLEYEIEYEECEDKNINNREVMPTTHLLENV